MRTRFATIRGRFETLVLGGPLRPPTGLLCAVAVVALAAFAYAPLLPRGLLVSGDTAHAFRVYEMVKCLDDGQVPCRWAPDLGNGYGQPLFNYYAPLPYYVGAILHDVGLSYLRIASALFVLGLVGAGLSMFALARSLWGNLGGVVSAVAFVYAPYLALDVYLRGALAELWGFAFVPALLWAVRGLVTTGRARYTVLVALFTALLLLSHHLVAVIVAPAIAIWAGLLVASQGWRSWRSVLLGALGVAWGFGLAAFFILPVLTEGGLVQLDNVARVPFGDEYLYTTAFGNVRDLFLVRSTDYSWLLGGEDVVPGQIGWFHWALTGLALPLGLVFVRRRRWIEALAVLTFALAFGIGTFMTLSASRFIWDTFDTLRFLQFPFRYLGLVSLAAAGMAGAWVAVLRGRSAWQQLLAAALLTGVFVGSGQAFFHPVARCTEAVSQQLACPPDDAAYFSPQFAAVYRRSGIEAYLPEAVGTIPREAPPSPALVTRGEATISAVASGTDWLRLSVDATTPVQVQASVFDYPNWRVRIDGATVPHTASSPYGLITFEVPEGTHRIELRLEDTGLRRLGNALSLLSWALLAMAGAGLTASWFFRGWGARIRD